MGRQAHIFKNVSSVFSIKVLLAGQAQSSYFWMIFNSTQLLILVNILFIMHLDQSAFSVMSTKQCITSVQLPFCKRSPIQFALGGITLRKRYVWFKALVLGIIYTMLLSVYESLLRANNLDSFDHHCNYIYINKQESWCCFYPIPTKK